MRCIAHRGFAETYPENTVAAVESATRHTDAVEVDVRRCGSGELVVIHDETVDRVTAATGRVDGMALDRLQSLDVLGSGDGVPSLEDVLAAVPDGSTLNVELKMEGIAADTLALASSAGVDALVSSFLPGAIREAVDAGAGRVGYLYDDDENAVDRARRLGCTAIHPHWQQCVDDLVVRAHDEELSVNAWTVPSRHDAEALEYVGVDGVIVDRPEVCTG